MMQLSKTYFIQSSVITRLIENLTVDAYILRVDAELADCG